MMVEYRDEPQLTLDDFIYNVFNLPPFMKSPRHSSTSMIKGTEYQQDFRIGY